jgi:hypothetical protein
MWLSTTRDGWGRTALERLSFEYMDEARTIENEMSIPAAP